RRSRLAHRAPCAWHGSRALRRRPRASQQRGGGRDHLRLAERRRACRGGAGMSIRSLLCASPVMPVIVLDRLEDAVPLARALVGGGIRSLEITLRTPVALDAVRAIRREVPQALVGVGTVTTADDLRAAGAA